MLNLNNVALDNKTSNQVSFNLKIAQAKQMEFIVLEMVAHYHFEKD